MSDDEEFTLANGSALLMSPNAYISVNPNLFAPPPMLLDDALVLPDSSLPDAALPVVPRRGRPRIPTDPNKPRAPRKRKSLPPAVSAPANATSVSVSSSSRPKARPKAASSRRTSAPVVAVVPPPPVVKELSLADELDELPTDMILRENALLIDAIKELQAVDVDKAMLLQQQLQFNLVYLLSSDHHQQQQANGATASTTTHE
jgi:hypothetical protein